MPKLYRYSGPIKWDENLYQSSERPLHKDTGKPIEELECTLDTDTQKEISKNLAKVHCHPTHTCTIKVNATGKMVLGFNSRIDL